MMQQAMALELRAAVSLAELFCSQGQDATAGELLAPVVARFSTEPDSADLIQARKLLKTL